MIRNERTQIVPPLKNVAVSLIFTVILGPVGLLYGSLRGAIFMILLGIVVISSKLIFPIILLWVMCCVWGVAATEKYNRRIISAYS